MLNVTATLGSGGFFMPAVGVPPDIRYNAPFARESLMAKLLFRLNGVGEDEADDVRALLAEHQVDTYETDAGRWRISVAAIWLRDDQDYERARGLIDAYQQERTERLRQAFNAQLQSGEIPGLAQRFRERPVDFILVAVAILFITGLMLWPFFTVFS